MVGRIHTCSFCDYTTKKKSTLNQHEESQHIQARTFLCSHCDKSFSISGNLQRHLFIHSGQKPFKCTQCTKAFNNPSHLRRHVKNLHKKDPPGDDSGEMEQIDVKPKEALVCPRGGGGESSKQDGMMGNTLHIQ